jgi:hypothetical protein
MTNGQPDPYVLYAARSDGTLWYHDQLGQQVTQLTNWDGGLIRGLAMDPSDSQTVFAITATTLWGSTDGGSSWQEFSTQPPSTAFGALQAITIVPTQVAGQAVNLLVLGGLTGTVVTPEDGTPGLPSWYSAAADLPHIWDMQMAYDATDDVLAAATFGRGVWYLSDASTALLYPLAGATTTTAIVPSSVQAGAPLTLAAEVTARLTAAAVTAGAVSFYLDDDPSAPALLGTGAPDSNGHVNVAVPHGLPAGSHTILVAYGGDSTDAMSRGTAALTVAPGATAVSLSAPGSVLASAPLALSATVSAVAPGLGIPNGGTVMFLSDGVPLGSAAVSAAGTASLLVPNGLSGGEHSLSAVYQPPGVGPFAGGASAPIAVIDANGVSGPGPSATTLSIAPIFLSGPSRVPPWLGGRRTMVQIVAHVVSSAGAAASGSVALLVANRVVSIG